MFFLPRPDHIAVVELFGPVASGHRVAELVRIFGDLERNLAARAVLVDVDCPGGSVAGSDHLHLALRRLAAQKPVVAFVRGMAASGGYLAICAARRIVALPTSVIGSIGVLSMRPIVSDLLTRLGIRMTVHKRGAFKDMWSPFREPTKEEEAREQALIDEFYERFVRSVADARGMKDERVREIATGEVFTGAKALEAGLVDETGDFETAVAAAMRLGGVERRLVTYRPRRTLRERLLGGFATEVSLALEDALWRGAYGTFEFHDRAPGAR